MWGFPHAAGGPPRTSFHRPEHGEDDVTKVMIEAATVGCHKRNLIPDIPYTNDEIVTDAKAAVAAGASLIHIHVRDRDGNCTNDPGDYGAVTRRLRELPDPPIVWPSF